MEWMYIPFPFATRSTPSTFVAANTLGFADSINDHIRWYVEKFELRKNEAYSNEIKSNGFDCKRQTNTKENKIVGVIHTDRWTPI